MQPVVMTIAGSDSSGGAGIQADLKTFAAFRCYGASAITAVTVQNTVGVTGVHKIPVDVVVGQVAAVLNDLPVRAVKTGMLVDKELVIAVVAALDRDGAGRIPVVVDPVLISKSGHALLHDDAVDAVRARLVPRATLLTPNLPEAARLTGLSEFDVGGDGGVEAARRLLEAGAAAVLVKGGHGKGNVVVDRLVTKTSSRAIETPRLDTRHTHGTGCTLSAAIAAGLAHGKALDVAVDDAIAFVHRAIASAPGLGRGHGPLNHLP